MSDETRSDWMCAVCGNLNGVGMTAAPMNCMRCGLMRGARSYPAYCPSCGKTVHDRCGHEGLTVTAPSLSLPSARSSTTGTPALTCCDAEYEVPTAIGKVPCPSHFAEFLAKRAGVAPPSRGASEPAMCASCQRPLSEHGEPHAWDTAKLPSCPPPSLTGTYRAGALPEDAPTPEQLDALRAAGRDPAPYVPTYLTASGATPPADEAFARLTAEAALGRSLLAALETVPDPSPLGVPYLGLYADGDVCITTPDRISWTDATRALSAALQRVKP
jgi:hypothetical protein